MKKVIFLFTVISGILFFACESEKQLVAPIQSESSKISLQKIVSGSGIEYEIIDLGISSYSQAFAINDVGQIVGGLSDNRCFLWENGIMTTELPFSANDINNVGQIVGTGGFGSWHAYLYDNDDITDLGSLGGENTFAMGINDMGQIVDYLIYYVENIV